MSHVLGSDHVFRNPGNSFPQIWKKIPDFVNIHKISQFMSFVFRASEPSETSRFEVLGKFPKFLEMSQIALRNEISGIFSISPNLVKRKFKKYITTMYLAQQRVSIDRTYCVAVCLGGRQWRLGAVATEDTDCCICYSESQYKSHMHMLQPSTESKRCEQIASSMRA